jgi:hypothetical protein
MGAGAGLEGGSEEQHHSVLNNKKRNSLQRRLSIVDVQD